MEEAKKVEEQVEPLKPTEPKPFIFDVNSVIFFMYLMYKRNLLTRHDIRSMFKIIKQPLPENGDLMKYLVDEEKKGT